MTITPIYVSVEDAAKALAISRWSMYQLLDEGAVESRYKGRRRLVLYTSLQEYADNLPTEPASA